MADRLTAEDRVALHRLEEKLLNAVRARTYFPDSVKELDALQAMRTRLDALEAENAELKWMASNLRERFDVVSAKLAEARRLVEGG